MAVTSRKPARLAGKIFRAADAVSAGLLTSDDLRGPGWRRLFRGVYADADLACSHQQQCHAAARYVLPARAAIAGRSAARLYGVTICRDTDPVEVLTPTTARFGPVAGLTIHASDFPDQDVRVRQGIRVTTPARTCWDLAGWLAAPDAVAYLDRILSQALVTQPELAELLRERRGQRGWRRLEKAVALADPAAESVQESRLRVRLVLAGLPKPVSHYVIGTAEQFGGRVDLAWPEYRVAIEYDGRWHTGVDQFEADRARLNRLVTTDDWIILHVTARRLREDFDRVVAEVRAALRSRRPVRARRVPRNR